MNVFSSLSENDATVSTCVNCTTPANLLATLALISIGIGLARFFEIRKEVSRRPCCRGGPLLAIPHDDLVARRISCPPELGWH